MPKEGEVHIDMTEVTSAMQRWAAMVEESAEEVVKEEARLFYQDAVRTTPPRTKAKGRKKVEADIRKTMAPLPKPAARTPWLKSVIRSQSEEAMRRFVERNHRAGKYPYMSKSPRKFDRALHERQRRKGRVPRGARRYQMMTTKDNAERARYVRERQANIGFMKACYAAAAIRAGSTRIPQWVAQKVNKARSSVRIEARFSGPNPGIALTAPTTEGLRRQLDELVRLRKWAMEHKIDLWLKGKADRINTRFTTR